MNNHVIIIKIPIINQNNTNIYEQQLFFNNSPTKNEVIIYLEELIKLDKLDDYVFQQCLHIVYNIPLVEWRYVNETVFQNVIFIDTKFGRFPFVWQYVSVFKCVGKC